VQPFLSGAVRINQIIPLTNLVSVRTYAALETEAVMGTNGNASQRTEAVEIRMTTDERAYARAAETAGRTLSTWSRMPLLREAKAAT
jgi:hypothetical protein